MKIVAVGAVAAWSVSHATNRFSWFSAITQRATYFSGAIIAVIGIYVRLNGWLEINT